MHVSENERDRGTWFDVTISALSFPFLFLLLQQLVSSPYKRMLAFERKYSK